VDYGPTATAQPQARVGIMVLAVRVGCHGDGMLGARDLRRLAEVYSYGIGFKVIDITRRGLAPVVKHF